MNDKYDRIDLIGPEVIALWIGPKETYKVQRRFVLFPFLSMVAVTACVTILLFVILWYAPGSADGVARLFATERFQGYFPSTGRVNSYLAQKNGDLWEIFLPAILAVNMASCLIASVFFSCWIFYYRFPIIKDANTNNSQLIARSRATAGRAIFIILLFTAIIVFVVYIGLFGGSPSRDFGQARRSITLYIVMQHLLIMFVPTAFAMIAFLLKFRRALERLDAR